jgi:2-dehydro-3-deoxyphosphogluconate aldolase/(4S)-4-hydroxy-2-oxoglutarate aldolase
VTNSLNLEPKAIIAVVEIEDPNDAPELAKVLAESGIDALEITFRTPGAMDALKRAIGTDGISVGAGTVLDVATVRAVADAGADFLISPGFDAELIETAASVEIPAVPGVITPTELQAALRAGCTTVKLFPAERFGGLQLVKTLSAVFTTAEFIPTGGITHALALDYFAHPRVSGIGGSWIAPSGLIRSRDWSEISRRATAIKTDRDGVL